MRIRSHKMNEERLWAVLDEIRNDVKDLCIRTAVIETDLENHLEGQKRKFDKRMIVLGIIIAIVAIVAGLK